MTGLGIILIDAVVARQETQKRGIRRIQADVCSRI